MTRADFFKRCAAAIGSVAIARRMEPVSEPVEIVRSGYVQAEPFVSSTMTVTHSWSSGSYTVAYYGPDGRYITETHG